VEGLDAKTLLKARLQAVIVVGGFGLEQSFDGDARSMDSDHSWCGRMAVTMTQAIIDNNIPHRCLKTQVSAFAWWLSFLVLVVSSFLLWET
jgi:hypothetical protein